MSKIALAVCGALVVGGGVLLVLSLVPLSPARSIAACQSVENKALCYTDRINETLSQRGLSAAFDALAAAYDADPDFAGTCHAETHELGKAAYERFHATGKVELSSKASYCGYGFYHGFMEALLAETNDLDEARSFCAYAGRAVPEPRGYAEGACYHGIGHGVTDGSDPRSWGDAKALAAPGLALCRQVAPAGGDWGRRCASGVFNSIAILYRDPKYKLATDNPFTLCSAPYAELEKESCYDQMNTLATFMAKKDLSKAIGYTEEIVDTKYRGIAVKGTAGFYVQILKSAKKKVTPKETSDVCGALGAPFRDECVKGLVDGMMEFGEPGEQYREILILCEDEDLSSGLRPACFGRLVFLSGLFYTKEQVRAVCRNIPEEYQDATCRPPRSST